ncbi:MAG: porin family protein, partial [Treponema sp.]|nr:porin family protein [Treponema sp.]
MRKIFCFPVFLFFILTPAFGQWDFSLRAAPGAAVPLGNDNFKTGMGGFMEFGWAFLPWLGVEIGGSYSSLPVADGSNVSFLEGGGGPFFQYAFSDRFSLKAGGSIGIYRMTWNNQPETLGRLGGALSGEFRLSPYIFLYAFGGYTWYNNNPPLTSVSAGAGVGFNLTRILARESRVRGEKTRQERVFPVSYAWYETHPLAAVRITNNESNAVTDLSLSFYLERYMNRPVVFANIPRLAPGEQAEAPLTALFNESILDLTENIVTNAVVFIDYRILGSKKQARFPLQLPI